MKESPDARKIRINLCNAALSVGLSLPKEANALTVKQIAEGLALLRTYVKPNTILSNPVAETSFRNAVALLSALTSAGKWETTLAEAMKQWNANLDHVRSPVSVPADGATPAQTQQ